MGIYYYAVDFEQKKLFSAPDGYGIKDPSVYHPENPFPGMLVMKLINERNFKIIADIEIEFEDTDDFEDITREVYEEYREYFPSLKEINWDEPE